MLTLKFETRRINRALWKVIWRQLRIANRESRLAYEDLIIFGTGALEIGAEVPDLIRRVPPEEIWFAPDGQPELRA